MTTFLRLCCTGSVLLGLLAATPLQAQEIHVGFVKTERVLKEATEAKAAQAKLALEFSKREKDIVNRETSLKSAVDKFQLEAATMPESQRNARQKQLVDQDRELLLMRRNFQEDLSARKKDELSQFLAHVDKVIKRLAEAEKYDVIFQSAVYVNPKYDMTDTVLKALNAQKDK
ncbi:MAG: OmpH family outer membrane protein [Rhodoferax sp.]|nr:OmpH family outer membrane protein [Rhodoferax sp.]